MKTQCDRILEAMKRGESFTRVSALSRLGVANFPARVLELKQSGHDIADEWIEVENRFGEACRVKKYRLVQQQ